MVAWRFRIGVPDDRADFNSPEVTPQFQTRSEDLGVLTENYFLTAFMRSHRVPIMSSDLSAIAISQLKQAIRIKQKIASLTAQLDTLFGHTSSSNSNSVPRKGRMSAAGRAAIRAGQKARWAKVKGKAGRKGKRTMSAAARARISASAKRRWKAAKAAGKSRL